MMFGLLNDEQRYKHVMWQLEQHRHSAEQLGYNIFAIIVQGSQNYDLDLYTDNYSSDVDTKCIVIPKFDDFCNRNATVSFTHVQSDNSHIDIKDVDSVFQLFKKQNIQYMELLFSDFYWVNSNYKVFWDALMRIRNKISISYPSQLIKTMCGMSMEKYKALKHPYPTIIDKINKYGYDGKQLHHIIRINEFMKNYISGVPFSECFKTFSGNALDCMMRAKLNEFTLSTAEVLAKNYNDENITMKEEFIKNYTEEPDLEYFQQLDNIEVALYKQAFKEEILHDNCS